MSDWWTASIKLQRDLLDATKASTQAGEAWLTMQEQGRKMAEANLAAMTAWAKMWGVGR